MTLGAHFNVQELNIEQTVYLWHFVS